MWVSADAHAGTTAGVARDAGAGCGTSAAACVRRTSGSARHGGDDGYPERVDRGGSGVQLWEDRSGELCAVGRAGLAASVREARAGGTVAEGIPWRGGARGVAGGEGQRATERSAA